MITIKRKALILSYSQIWFANEISILNIWKIITYKQSFYSKKRFGFIKKEFATVEIDLTQSVDQIFMNFSNTIKNEIRRAQQEHIMIKINNDLELFQSFFNEFAINKGINPITFEKLKSHENKYLLTFALSEQAIISAHYYLVDKQSSRVRLLYSASARFSDSNNRNFIGRANKLLHFEDMKYFKEIGMEIMDFGGITIPAKTKEQIGINSFKESFGGIRKFYSEYNSLLYNIFSKFHN